jgi:16S rRNA (uracil1498-N3)-methyltransferase
VVLVLVPPSLATPGQAIPLDDDEQHHLRVRRIAAGTEVGFVDGQGGRGVARLTSAGKSFMLEVVSAEQVARATPIVLAVAAGDRDRMGWLVEKATELGVTDLVPLETERTLGVATRLKASHLDGLRRRSRESLKQCGGSWAVQVHEIAPLGEFLSRTAAGTRWMLDAAGDRAEIRDTGESLTALVGPEGGLTADERQQALDHGFNAVRAGPHVLRFETAAVAAAALAQSLRAQPISR